MIRRTLASERRSADDPSVTESAEKVCPDCAEAVKAQARVCRFCGYRFDTASASRKSAADTIFGLPSDRRGWFLLWGLASALLMVLGLAGPWIRIGAFANGGIIERRNGGLLLFAAALLGAAGLVVWRERRAGGTAALLGGLAGLAVGVHDRRHLGGLVRIRHLVPGPPFLPRFAHAGWGLDLALLASLSLTLCGVVWLLALRDDPQERVTLTDATPPAG